MASRVLRVGGDVHCQQVLVNCDCVHASLKDLDPRMVTLSADMGPAEQQHPSNGSSGALAVPPLRLGGPMRLMLIVSHVTGGGQVAPTQLVYEGVFSLARLA